MSSDNEMKNHETSRQLTDEVKALSDVADNDAFESRTNAESRTESCSVKWSKGIKQFVHKPVKSVILPISLQASIHPEKFVIGIILLSLATIVIGLFTNFNIETDDKVLFTPFGALPVQHADWIDDESGFEADRGSLNLVFHADGQNVVNQQSLSRVFEAFDLVRDTSGYGELCSKDISGRVDLETGEPTCFIASVTQYWNNSVSSFQSTVSSDEEAISVVSRDVYPTGERVDRLQIMGNSRKDKDTQEYKFAQSFSLIFLFPAYTSDLETESNDLLRKAIDRVLDLQAELGKKSGKALRLEIISSRSFEDELNRSISSDIVLVPIVFVMMSIFCFIVFSKKSKVRSRGMLGFGAVVSVLLSIMTGYGLFFMIGIPLTSMTQLLPFIMFGIGLDDAFIIIGEYERTDKSKDPVDRIQDTMEASAVAIFLTTITSVLAFATGCSSSIPVVYWLCLYAFPTIFFVFLYMITFFVALIVIDEKRLQANRRGCLVCSIVKDERNKDDEEETTQLPLAERVMIWYSDKLLRPWVKVTVVVFFTALLAGLAYSTTLLEVKFDFLEVLPSDSYIANWQNSVDSYAEYSGILPDAYFRFVNQSDPVEQDLMESYINALVDEVDIIGYQPVSFWLRDFKVFVNSTVGMEGLTFNEQIAAFLDDSIYGILHKNNIVINDTGDITASRCKLLMDGVDLTEVKNQIDALEEQRSVSRRQPSNQGLNDWAYFTLEDIYYIWEFYASSVDELIQTTVLGVSSVTVLALIFMPHWSGFLFVGPAISILYIDLLGVLQLAGVAINPVSYIGLVMSIGLMVDYVVHTVLRYYESPAKDREGKVKDMLRTMGSSVLIGGISTVLGVMPLAFASSNIFFTIFVIFCGLVVLGMLHGLVLLPVILSMVGPLQTVE